MPTVPRVRAASVVEGWAFVHPYKGQFAVWLYLPLEKHWARHSVETERDKAGQIAYKLNRRMQALYPGEDQVGELTDGLGEVFHLSR